MYMNRSVSVAADELREMLERNGAQRMRSDPDVASRGVADGSLQALDDASKSLQIGYEPALTRGRRRTAEIAGLVEDRQQGDVDAGGLRCRQMSYGELRRVIIECAVRVAVHVVEFSDAGEASFQHVSIGVGRDGFHVVRLELPEKAVHHLAPGPEVVGSMRTPTLGKPG